MQKTVYGRRFAWMRLRPFTPALSEGRLQNGRLFRTGSKPFMLAMKLTILLLTAAFFQVHATAVSQTVTLSGKELSLKKIFSVIEKQTGYVVLSNKQHLEATKPVTLSVYDIALPDLLNLILRDQPINYRLDGNTIVIMKRPVTENPLNRLLQTPAGQPVHGRLIDSAGRAIEGASVKLKPGNKGTISAQGGYFTILNVEAGDYTLEISFVGFETINKKVTVYPYNQLNLGSISMKTASTNLNTVEIIATGYQSLPRERSTGSFTTINTELLTARAQTNLLSRLEGTVPGLYMNKGSVNIRGLATLYGDREPLYVVDGFPFEGDINYLNPDDVVNVTVLRDAAATSIYGTRAANGVISITTRLGSAKQTRINYNSSIFITPIPDASYLNFMNSSEAVDLQKELFNKFHTSFNDYLKRAAQSKVTEALYQHEQGEITEAQLNARLSTLKTLNAQPQIEDMLMQSEIKHRHSLSITGGNNVNQYNLIMNYTGERGYTKHTSGETINIGVNDRAQIFKWLTGEIGIYGNFDKSNGNSIAPTSYYWNMPYEVLTDESGNIVPWNYRKSQYEINRLIGLGLLDENFNPLWERDRTDFRRNSNYLRAQGGFNIKITKDLSLDLKYQTETRNDYSRTFYDKDAFAAATMINNGTTYKHPDTIYRAIPEGGQIYEIRANQKSYTARAQLNFDKTIGKNHQILALAGTERRAIKNSGTTVNRFGYNDNNLQFRPINADSINQVKGTESINDGIFNYNYNDYNKFVETEYRYVSFYGNAGYTFKHRYNVTGSVRIDESNLFGTDPRYRYLPLWSAGVSWRASQEDFLMSVNWLNNLNFRATYGLGGNVARQVGPFLQAESRYFAEVKAMATNILNPPNKSLRWEKTVTTNLGVDFGILRNRISGSIDYYKRNSTDLLGEKKTDPTNAFSTALINYGSLTNTGIEIALNTVNIDKKFKWNTRLAFGHNKNKMTDISPTSELISAFVDGRGMQRVGYAMNSLFNYRIAGLDPTNGTPLVYDKEGKVVKNYDQSGNFVSNMNDAEALVYSGTLTPTYTVGVTNTFSYGGFTLNVMLIANGGNVLRDVPMVINNSNIQRNFDRRSLNYWKKPGDENIPGILPATNLRGHGAGTMEAMWYASDINTIKADYIKIRDISLAYEFSPLLSRLYKISSAKLLLQVTNGFSWFRNDRDIDPEAYETLPYGSYKTLPVMPSYTIGLNLTF